ncbi:hypothetical protein KSS87_000543, partial [Heliosperma pusillum]
TINNNTYYFEVGQFQFHHPLLWSIYIPLFNKLSLHDNNKIIITYKFLLSQINS